MGSASAAIGFTLIGCTVGSYDGGGSPILPKPRDQALVESELLDDVMWVIYRPAMNKRLVRQASLSASASAQRCG
jgi:hypothetical protein